MAVKIRAVIGTKGQNDRKSDAFYEDKYKEYKNNEITEEELIEYLQENEQKLQDEHGYIEGDLAIYGGLTWFFNSDSIGADRLSGTSGAIFYKGGEAAYWTERDKSTDSSKDRSKDKDKSEIDTKTKSMYRHVIKQLIIWGEGPDDVIKYLDKNAFKGAQRLESVYIFCPVESVGDFCFADCKQLHTVCFFGGVGRFERGCFMNAGTEPLNVDTKGYGKIYFGTLKASSNNEAYNVCVDYIGRDKPHWYNSAGVSNTRNYATSSNLSIPIMIGDACFYNCKLTLDFLTYNGSDYDGSTAPGDKQFPKYGHTADPTSGDFVFGNTNNVTSTMSNSFPFDCRLTSDERNATSEANKSDHRKRVDFLEKYTTKALSFGRPLQFGWQGNDSGLNGSNGFAAFYKCTGLSGHYCLKPYAGGAKDSNGAQTVLKADNTDIYAKIGHANANDIIGIFEECTELDTVCIDTETNAPTITADNGLGYIKVIPKQLFKKCTSLTKVWLSTNYITDVQESAFEECTLLNEIALRNADGTLSITKIAKKALYNCPQLLDFFGWNVVQEIQENAFALPEGTTRTLNNGLILPEHTRTISSKAFAGTIIKNKLDISAAGSTALLITEQGDPKTRTFLSNFTFAQDGFELIIPSAQLMAPGVCFLSDAHQYATNRDLTFNRVTKLYLYGDSETGKRNIQGHSLPTGLQELRISQGLKFYYPAFTNTTALTSLIFDNTPAFANSYFSYVSGANEALPFKQTSGGQGSVYIKDKVTQDNVLITDIDLNELYPTINTNTTCSMNVFYNSTNLPLNSITLHTQEGAHDKYSPGKNVEGGGEIEVERVFVKRLICNNILTVSHIGVNVSNGQDTNIISETYRFHRNGDLEQYGQVTSDSVFIVDCSNSVLKEIDSKYYAIPAGTFLQTITVCESDRANTNDWIVTPAKIILPANINILEHSALEACEVSLVNQATDDTRDDQDGYRSTITFNNLFEVQQNNFTNIHQIINIGNTSSQGGQKTYFNNSLENILLKYVPWTTGSRHKIDLIYDNMPEKLQVIALEAIEPSGESGDAWFDLNLMWFGISWKYPYAVASAKTQLKSIFKNGYAPVRCREINFYDGLYGSINKSCNIKTSNDFAVLEGIERIQKLYVQQANTEAIQGPIYKTPSASYPLAITTVEFAYGIIPGFLANVAYDTNGVAIPLKITSFTASGAGALTADNNSSGNKCYIKIQTSSMGNREPRTIDHTIAKDSFTAIASLGNECTLFLGDNITSIYETWAAPMTSLHTIQIKRTLGSWGLNMNFAGPNNNPMFFCPYMQFLTAQGGAVYETNPTQISNWGLGTKTDGIVKQYTYANNNFLNSINVSEISYFETGALDNARAMREIYCSPQEGTNNAAKVYSSGLSRLIWGPYVNTRPTDANGTKSTQG